MDNIIIMMLLTEFLKKKNSSHCHEKIVFHINLLTYKILITKLKQKYNVYHVNNLKRTVQFTIKWQLYRKNVIIGHICYSKHAQL